MAVHALVMQGNRALSAMVLILQQNQVLVVLRKLFDIHVASQYRKLLQNSNVYSFLPSEPMGIVVTPCVRPSGQPAVCLSVHLSARLSA